MMRMGGLLVVTYRPVGTSTLDARSTDGFPVRGESTAGDKKRKVKQ